MNISNEFIQQSIKCIEENTSKIKTCLQQVKEENVWERPNESSNSIGNLLLHLCGNITQYIIATLGSKEDIRNRDAEFAATGGFTKEQLQNKLSAVIDEAISIIKLCDEEKLLQQKSVQVYTLSGIGIILHVTEHYSYHTGQVAFLTKLITNKDIGFYAGIDLNRKN